MSGFVDAVAARLGARWEAALRPAVEALRARAVVPGVSVPDDVLADAIVTRLGDDVAAALDTLHAADVALAVACASGDRAALERFERHLVPELHATLRRGRYTPSEIDEALQRLREELLVARPGKRAGILAYGGRGELVRWLRAVAGRVALRVAHTGRGEVALSDSLPVEHGRDLELDHLREKYGAAFRSAYAIALRELPTADRMLLKQRFRHHLNVTELGVLHGVHASTISRRVTQARDALVDGTRRHMMAQLELGESEVASILQLIRSDLDVNLTLEGERAVAGG